MSNVKKIEHNLIGPPMSASASYEGESIQVHFGVMKKDGRMRIALAPLGKVVSIATLGAVEDLHELRDAITLFLDKPEVKALEKQP